MTVQFNGVKIYLLVLWCFNPQIIPPNSYICYSIKSHSSALCPGLQAWKEGQENT